MAADNASIEQRAGDPVPDAQDGLFDQVLDNDVLSQALERRQGAKEKQQGAAKKLKEADDQARGIISGLSLEPGTVVRCGRFRLKISTIAPRSVSFETGEAERLTISLLPSE